MDFSVFAHSRDLLCLSGAFTGLALGCLLAYFSRKLPRVSRSRRLALSLLFFSFTIAGLALAIIVSMGAIFKDRGVIAAALCCIPVFAMAARFPRTVGYPLILAGGLAAVWLGYSFLRFPALRISSVPGTEVSADAVPVASISTSGEGRSTVNFFQLSGNRAQAPLQITGSLSGLRISAAFISFERYIPLIGSTVRGMITEISRGNETLYADTSMQSRLVLNVKNASATLPFEAISPDMKLGVWYNGASLFITAQ